MIESSAVTATIKFGHIGMDNVSWSLISFHLILADSLGTRGIHPYAG
jgi:hypothetical protein